LHNETETIIFGKALFCVQKYNSISQ